jgi:hypothetical protein
MVWASAFTVFAEEQAGQSTLRMVAVSGATNQAVSQPRGNPWTRIESQPHVVEPSADENLRSNLVIRAAGEQLASAATNSVRQAQFTTAQPVDLTADHPSTAAVGATNPESSEPVGVQRLDGSTTAPVSESPSTPAGQIKERAPIGSVNPPQARPAMRMLSPGAVTVEDLQKLQQARRNIDSMGRPSSQTSLSQLPRRAPIRPATPATPRQKAKPFQGVQSGTTVSPYLNLYRNEDDGEGAPNYYAFVRPQVEQAEANQVQQLEIQRLQRQLQTGSATAGEFSRATSPAETGTAARFMDTQQFYSGWQR